MYRECCIVKKMRHPNILGLAEVSRRTTSKLHDLNEIFRVDRLIMMHHNSCLHKKCNRTLENRTLFYNFRQVIKDEIEDIFRICTEDQISCMEKHACYDLIIRGIYSY